MLFRYFENLTRPFPEGNPEQPPAGLLAFCRHYTRGYGRALAALAVLTLVIASIEVILFRFLGQLVDWLGQHDPATLLAEEAATLWGLSILVLGVLPVAVLLHSLLFHQSLFVNYSNGIRWRAHRYLLEQSHSFYQDELAGRLATKVMQTAESLRETVMKLLDVLLYVLVYLTGMTALVASADWRLSLPLLIWLGCYALLLVVEIPRLRAQASRQADALSGMTGRIVDSYTNFTTLKLFSHSSRESAYARHSMETFLGAVYPLMRRVTRLNVAVWLLNALLIFSTAALAITLWTEQAVTAGAITVAIALTLRLKSLSQFLMWEIAGLFRNVGTVQDGLGTLSRPRAVQDRPGAPSLEIKGGRIDFDRIRFGYPGQPPLFDGLSLAIRPGEKVGIVGSSGAGKSTLMGLLLRFYDLDGGRILIDGQAVDAVTQESLRARIAVVSQDTALLNRSIRDNLLYGNPEADEAAMIAAAAKAHIHDPIQQLADSQGRRGYDVEVGDRGVKLSGGQRQRIAIARALLKDAPILVLDEATSALDSEVEAAIQSHLEILMAGKTVIAIAHRLSTIAALDRLIVLERGQLVESGTHQELLARNGRYARLWRHQSGGFLAQA